MPREPSDQAYKQLAQYYDLFFTSHRSGYRRARQELLGDLLLRVRSACDLACGTGETALELVRRGIPEVFAVDLSPTMRKLARAKAQRAGVPVVILRGDMRSFHLPRPVDLVTCEYDAVNHVPRKSDLARVAKAVARALRPGGTFYFDVNNRLHLQKVWPGTQWLEASGVVMVMHGSYNSRRARARINVEWFIKHGTCWRRFHDCVEEVWWTAAEIRGILRAAGFGRIRAYDATTLFEAGPNLRPGCRTFYLAERQPAGG